MLRAVRPAWLGAEVFVSAGARGLEEIEDRGLCEQTGDVPL